MNLWRMDASGANIKQLTFGSNETDPQCSQDPNWVVYVDHGDNHAVKRISLEGGQPETLLKEATTVWTLSPEGKRLVSMEVRELDHKLTLTLYSIDDKKASYRDLDQRASWPLAFAPDAKAVVYVVREKGVDNLWEQPLDDSPPRQLTHFAAEQIQAFRFSLDGSKIAIERGHLESDAILLRDTSR
jgi:Tol biopolymer transport system component